MTWSARRCLAKGEGPARQQRRSELRTGSSPGEGRRRAEGRHRGADSSDTQTWRLCLAQARICLARVGLLCVSPLSGHCRVETGQEQETGRGEEWAWAWAGVAVAVAVRSRESRRAASDARWVQVPRRGTQDSRMVRSAVYMTGSEGRGGKVRRLRSCCVYGGRGGPSHHVTFLVRRRPVVRFGDYGSLPGLSRHCQARATCASRLRLGWPCWRGGLVGRKGMGIRKWGNSRDASTGNAKRQSTLWVLGTKASRQDRRHL